MGMDKITEIIKINRENIDRDAIGHCADVLRQGGLVCFPTETVYGLGANAYSAEAVNNIYKAKGRPADNPLIVHISDCKMLDLVTDCGGTQREILNRLAQTFWPGPLTVIASRDDAIPSNVSCGLDTVGIRFPSHPIARALRSGRCADRSSECKSVRKAKSNACYACYRGYDGARGYYYRRR